MKSKNVFRSAHSESVNSMIVSFNAGVVISFDEDSIRIWNPVDGTQVYQSSVFEDEDAVIPGLGSIYHMDEVTQFDS